MSDPLVLRRSTPSARRRSDRGRLPLKFDDDAERTKRPPRRKAPQPPAPAPTPSPVFQPLAYRGVVAGWSLEHRELWGRRANELEDAGLSWRDAETQAFVEVWRKRKTAG